MAEPGRAGLGAPFDYAEDVENAGSGLGFVGEEEGEDEEEDGEDDEDADQLSDMRAMMAQYTHARGAPDGAAGLMAAGIAGGGAVRGPVHVNKSQGAPAKGQGKAALAGWEA